jgi:hypothetical protein
MARNIYDINLLIREVGTESYYYMYNGHADVTALITQKQEWLMQRTTMMLSVI